MLYLIQPDSPTQWVNLPSSALPAVQPGVDVSTLAWQRSEVPPSPDVVRLALRYGVAVADGLLVDGGRFSMLRQPDVIRAAQSHSQASHAAVARDSGDFMEAVLPGWKDATRDLNARVDESINASITRAEADLQHLLDSAEPVPSLVEHWQTLGGINPNPA